MEFITRNLSVFMAASAVLLALILIMMVAGAFRRRTRGRRGQRLGVSEYHEIDENRRLVLVRRDNTEHLILIGGVQDLVIETGIGASAAYAPAMTAAETDDTPRAPPLIRPAPRPPVFGDRHPPLRSIEREEPVLAVSGVAETDTKA